MSARDEYMLASSSSLQYTVRGGEDFKAAPDRSVIDVMELEKRESAYMTSHGKNVLKPRVDPKGGIGPPLDYSYMEIKDIQHLHLNEPASGKAKPRPPPEVEGDGDNPTPAVAEPRKQPHLRTQGLRLGYNHMTHLDGAVEHVEKVMDDPINYLNMLDLSHNKFSTIPTNLCLFKNLSVLYLHGNQITNIDEVKKLKKLKNLQKLTLHGNAVFYDATEHQGRTAAQLQETNYYRPRIIYYLRGTQLKSLDNITITPKDRENALIWYKNFRGQ